MSRKKSLEELEAAGSARASSRRAERQNEALARRRAAMSAREKPPESAIIDPADHARILREMTGYDPEADPGESRFDPESARAAVRWVHEHVVHVKGDLAGDSFLMEPWQQAVVMALWGWRKPDGTRRYREALIYVPRGNGKTFLASALSLLAYFTDDEPGAEVYCAAAERKQAGILWNDAREIVRLDAGLAGLCEIGAHAITKLDDPLASFQAISSEAGSRHGYMPHMAVLDELHVQPNDKLYEAIRTGMRKKGRRQPLFVMLTTANFWEPEHICNRVHAHARKVRDGAVSDPSFLPVVFEATDADDWRDPAVWRRVNPNYGISVAPLDDEFRRAEGQPSELNSILRLHLNLMTNADEAWISMADWHSCAAQPVPDGPCYGGLDMSRRVDLTAFALYWPSTHSLRVWFWCPKATADRAGERDRVPYVQWHRLGYVSLTPGNTVDYNAVEADIARICAEHRPEDIAFDPNNASQITGRLKDEHGLQLTECPQSYSTMSPASKEFERLVVSGEMRHGGNPVLSWNVSNCMIRRSPREDIMPDKRASTGRIDGVAAGVMAVGLSSAHAAPAFDPEVYVV